MRVVCLSAFEVNGRHERRPPVVPDLTRFAAMGYLDDAASPEPIPVFMYDGAGSRAKVGDEVKFVLPSGRFQDGPRMSVRDESRVGSYVAVCRVSP